MEKLAPTTTSPGQLKWGLVHGNCHPVCLEMVALETEFRRVGSRAHSHMLAMGLDNQGHYSPYVGPGWAVTRAFIWGFPIHLRPGARATLGIPGLQTMGRTEFLSWHWVVSKSQDH